MYYYMSQKTQQAQEQSKQLPNELYMGFVFPNATIAALKNARLLSKVHKVMAEKELMKRYKKITRPDNFFNAVMVPDRTLPEIIHYLTMIEDNIVTPAKAAGRDGSQAQIDFLSNLLFDVSEYRKKYIDYPVIRYLLEHRANPNIKKEVRYTTYPVPFSFALINRFDFFVNNGNDEKADETSLMFALALRYSMIITRDETPAREIIENLHDMLVGDFPLILRDPTDWRSFSD